VPSCIAIAVALSSTVNGYRGAKSWCGGWIENAQGSGVHKAGWNDRSRSLVSRHAEPSRPASRVTRKVATASVAERPPTSAAERVLRNAEQDKEKDIFSQMLGLEGGIKRNALFLVVWVAIGTVFHYFDGFEERDASSWAAAFYYTVQCGLSIGFGILTPRSEWSMLINIGFIISGAALAAEFLSSFMTDAIGTVEKGRLGLVIKDRPDASLSFVFTALFAWMLVGTAFGIYHEHWTWTKALFFAVSATSTAGMQGLDSVDDFSLMFCACYSLVGVPLYAAAIGRLSFVFAEGTLKKRHSQIKERAVSIFRNCDEDCILDTFDMYVKDGSTIDQSNLKDMIKFLANSEGMVVTDDDVAYIRAEFDKDGDGQIDRDEFKSAVVRWISESKDGSKAISLV